MKTLDAKRVLEAALICSAQPMPLRELGALFADEIGPDTLRTLLDELGRECADRGIELVSLASGWRYQSRPEMASYLARLSPERPPRYSRAALETLAIVAYRQPVTRGDIEDIRGVAVATSIVKQLEDRGWIEAIGYRETPGRPALLATTRQFLDDLGLSSLDQLPALDGAGDDPNAGRAAIAALASQTVLSFAEASADPEALRAAGTPGGAGILEDAGDATGTESPHDLETAADAAIDSPATPPDPALESHS
ncbi:MAG: SMC-Scp complex subunit ScpB [Caldimonas sp.]